MDKTKFYRTVYKLVEDYFDNFSKKPNYLLINSKFDLAKFIDQEDLKQYVERPVQRNDDCADARHQRG